MQLIIRNNNFISGARTLLPFPKNKICTVEYINSVKKLSKKANSNSKDTNGKTASHILTVLFSQERLETECNEGSYWFSNIKK